MLPVGAVLVDFDGTACAHDAAEHLLVAFGGEGWAEHNDAVDRGAIGLREAIVAQDRMVDGSRDDLLDYVLEHCPMDPTFAPFCAWLADRGVPVTVVSDGFGFYIEPLLASVGLRDLPVITNAQRWTDEGRPDGLDFVSAHPVCVGCGTCKMLAVQAARAAHGVVAFVGEGQTDRYGALYADLVFAKDALPSYCEADGVPFTTWRDFDDIRRALEDPATLVPGPVAPVTCPGWTLTTA
jgi:2-hydroxy-3-keto-5-methylthiopentenyl-1-phosphate phosphatase